MLFRPRLRSKTGCTTCRKRRKKCDEKKPCCRDCSRHGLRCIWPGNIVPTAIPTMALVTQEDATATPPSCSSVSYRFLESRSDREHGLFQHFALVFMPLLVRSGAHPGYLDVNSICAAAANHPWMTDTCLGLAALHLARGDKEAQATADGYYCTAVGAYWRDIGKGDFEGTEDWLLLAAIFFYLFEQWRSTASSNIVRHLKGTAEIIRLRRNRCKDPVIAIQLSSPVDRIASESFIYHIATVSLFYEDVDQFSGMFSWNDIDEGLRCIPFPQASEEVNSPILGLSPDIYWLTFEATRLSRHAPLHDYKLEEAWQCNSQLDVLHHNLLSRTYLNGVSLDPCIHLYATVLDIFMAKLLHDEITSSDQHIQSLVQQSISLVRSSSLSHFSFPCIWPMMILACAIETPIDITLVKEKLIHAWNASFCGYVRRAALIIERTWQWRTQGLPEAGVARGRCQVKDGLQLLTAKHGLFSFLKRA